MDEPGGEVEHGTRALLHAAGHAAKAVKDVTVHFGPIYCSDFFYLDRPVCARPPAPSPDDLEPQIEVCWAWIEGLRAEAGAPTAD